MSWPVEVVSGSVTSLHGRDATSAPDRRVDVLHVDRPAMVLGSTQSPDVVDQAAAAADGIEVVRRRTGGGAVFLEPGQHVWLDVVLPAGDPLWDDDVARAFAWLGAVWRDALVDLGLTAFGVNQQAVCHSVLGRLVCFAGLGFGELSGPEGKVVGIAQRRTRDAVWFQCAVLRQWRTEPYARVLAPGLAAASDDPVTALASVRVQPVPTSADAVVDAVVRHLPR